VKWSPCALLRSLPSSVCGWSARLLRYVGEKKRKSEVRLAAKRTPPSTRALVRLTEGIQELAGLGTDQCEVSSPTPDELDRGALANRGLVVGV
jgi:hypothetical protein